MRLRCVIVDNDCEHPPWVEVVARKLAKCWKSPGGITMMVTFCEDDHWHLVCAPSIREIVGGVNDGSSIYARFQLNLVKAVRIFDRNPRIFFDTSHGEGLPFVILLGQINNEMVQLAIVSGPIPGQPTTELAHTLGPKKGTVESRLPQREDNGDDAYSE